MRLHTHTVNIGMGVFVLGLLFVSVVGNPFTVQAFYDDEVVPSAVPRVFEFVAPFNLAKIMADITLAYSTSDADGRPKNATGTAPHPGRPISLHAGPTACVPAPAATADPPPNSPPAPIARAANPCRKPVPHPEYTWESMYKPQCILKLDEDGEYYCKPYPSTNVSVNYLVLNFFMFAFLTWYLDQVLPSTSPT